MNKVLAHPAICNRLVIFLPPTTLKVCVRVCKIWQKTFIPFLWRKFQLKSSYYQNAKSISKHAYFVNDLISNVSPFQDIITKSPTLVFPQLTSLIFDDNYACHLDNDDLEPFMKKHGHTLKHLSIGQLYNDDQMNFDWMAHCKVLESFYLSGRGMHYTKFWKICVLAWRSSRLQELELNDVYFPAISLNPWENEKEKTEFLSGGGQMSIRRFTLRRICQVKLEQCLTFLKLCPELRHIGLVDCRSMMDRPSMDQFISSLQEGHWPHLTSMNLDFYWGNDLAQIIEARANVGLTELDLRNSGFDYNTWTAILRYPRLVTTLETLLLLNCRYVTSSMVHTILASLPHIVRFSATEIHDGDDYEGIDSRRWVCLGLKTFRVTIRVYGGREGHAAFHRKLGLLTNLEQLWTSEDHRHHNGLSFRLGAGLGPLRGLGRNLKDIKFAKPELLSKTDVSWMVFHWPRLELAPKPVLDAYNKKRWRI